MRSITTWPTLNTHHPAGSMSSDPEPHATVGLRRNCVRGTQAADDVGRGGSRQSLGFTAWDCPRGPGFAPLPAQDRRGSVRHHARLSFMGQGHSQVDGAARRRGGSRTRRQTRSRAPPSHARPRQRHVQFARGKAKGPSASCEVLEPFCWSHRTVRNPDYLAAPPTRVNSVRRFLALPTAVLFGSMGLSMP